MVRFFSVLSAFALLNSFSVLAQDHPLFSGRQSFLAGSPWHLEEKRDQIKVAFFDLDGTIRISNNDQEIITDAENIKILPHVVEKLIELKQKGYFIAIVSNHAWVPKTVSHQKASELILKTIRMLNQKGARVDYYDYAGSNKGSLKPEIGMAKILEQQLKDRYQLSIDYSSSFMVGDNGYSKNTSDSDFAKNLKIKYISADTFFGWGGCDPKLLVAD